MSEELREKREEFDKHNSIRKMGAINKTCWQLIYEIIQSKGLSKSRFHGQFDRAVFFLGRLSSASLFT